MRIHCKNKTIIKANQFYLACASEFLRSLFTAWCPCADAQSSTFDLICPDFEPEAVEKVLAMVTGQNVFINVRDKRLYREIHSVLNQLQIKIQLPPILSPDSTEGDFSTSSSSKDKGVEAAAGSEHLLNDKSLESCPTSQPVKSGQLHLSALRQQEFRTPGNQDLQIKLHLKATESLAEDVITNEGGLDTTAHRPQAELPKRKLVLSSEVNQDNSPLTTVMTIKEELKDYDSGLEQDLSAIIVPDPVTSEEISVNDSEQLADQQIVSSIGDQSTVTQAAGSTSATVTNAEPEPDWYECHICQKKSTKYFNIVLHIGRKHFRDELERLYHPSKRNSCRACQKKFLCAYDLDTHIVRSHRAIERLVPSIDQLRVLKPDEDLKQYGFQASNPSKRKNSGVQPDIRNKKVKPDKTYSEVQSESISARDQEHKEQKEAEQSGSGSGLDFSLHQCPECPFRVQRISNLKCHFATIHRKQDMLSLAGASGVDCSLCQKSFAAQGGLLFHLANSHDTLRGVFSPRKDTSTNENMDKSETAMPSPTTGQVYPCPLCSQDFGGYKDLLSHMAIEHFKADLLKSFPGTDNSCQECTNLSKSENKDNLVKHLAIQHLMLTKQLQKFGQKKLECSACGKTFKKTCGWVIHERMCKLKIKPKESPIQV